MESRDEKPIYCSECDAEVGLKYRNGWVWYECEECGHVEEIKEGD